MKSGFRKSLLSVAALSILSWSEGISILDFKIKSSASKKVSKDDAEYLSGRVRAAAAASSRNWTVMSRENIQQILKDNNKDFAECVTSAEGACEVGVGRILQSDYHVAGDIAVVGGHSLALSVRLYDVHSGKLIKQEDVRAASSDKLIDAVDGLAQNLFALPGHLAAQASPASPPSPPEPRKADTKPPVAPNTFKDPRDGKVYKTVTIGSQTWMAENMNYATDSSMCYDHDSRNCEKYGRFYPWGQANNSVCPENWRLPDTNDWNTLINNAGGKKSAATNLESTVPWWAARIVFEKGTGKIKKDENGSLIFEKKDDSGGIDKFGFNILPSGHLGGIGNYKNDIGHSAYFWTATTKPNPFNSILVAGAYHIGFFAHAMTDYSAEPLECPDCKESVRCIKR